MEGRRVIALVAVVAVTLGGCASPTADPAGFVTMEPADTESFADRFSTDVPEAFPGSLSQRRGVREAIANGSTTLPQNYGVSLVDRPYVSDGRYYDVSVTTVDERRGYEVEVSFRLDDDGDGDPIEFSDLPSVDRERIAPVLDLLHERNGTYEGDEYLLAYTTEEGARSVFVEDRDEGRIVYDGTVVSFRVTQDDVETIQVNRYESTLVAESADAYAADRLPRYLVDLSGLSANESVVVEEAIDGRYVANTTDDEAYDSLVDEFRSRPPVEHMGGVDEWIARYDGRLYWARLEYHEFVSANGTETPSERIARRNAKRS